MVNMEEAMEKRYCENCKKETLHVLREDALEIESTCNECNEHEQIIKTFF